MHFCLVANSFWEGWQCIPFPDSIFNTKAGSFNDGMQCCPKNLKQAAAQALTGGYAPKP